MTPQEMMSKIDDATEPGKMTQREALDFLLELQSLIDGAIEGLRDDMENED